MSIVIKTAEQTDKMRLAGNVVAKTFEYLQPHIKPGITTLKLNNLAEAFILKMGAVPSFKGYHGYPGAICTSVNDEVVHGIPSERILLDGDILSIDIGAYLNGYHGDAAKTYPVGKISTENQKLINVCRESFYEGLKFAKEGFHLHDIGEAIQKHVEANGFSVVRDFVGHGIGANMHEAPQIPNYRPKNRGPKLSRGMTLAIEPMINAGTYDVYIVSDDGWTVKTADGENSSHYEHTVLITNAEPEILTK